MEMKVFQHLLLLICLAISPLSFADTPININTADKQTLIENINGVGEKKAEAIIAYRESNGPFKSIDDLSKVKGISDKTIEKNKAMLSLD